eukprot:UN06429
MYNYFRKPYTTYSSKRDSPELTDMISLFLQSTIQNTFSSIFHHVWVDGCQPLQFLRKSFLL